MSREQSLQLRRVKKQIRFTPYKKPPPAAEEAAVEINLSTLVQPSTSKQLFKQQPIIQGKDLLVPSVTPKEESLIENTISYWQTKYPNQKKIAIVPPRQNSQRSIALKVTQNSSESTSRSTYQIIPPAEQALAIKIPKKSDLKILVILDNGEQRLVAFNPKETCTVQELLNQMKIEVVADSKYECIERPSPEIHYLIKIGRFAMKDTSEMLKNAVERVRKDVDRQRALEKCQSCGRSIAEHFRSRNEVNS